MVRLLGRRELLAYMYSATMCFLAIYSILTQTYTETIITGFIAMCNAIIGFYFGQRSGQKPQEDAK